MSPTLVVEYKNTFVCCDLVGNKRRTLIPKLDHISDESVSERSWLSCCFGKIRFIIIVYWSFDIEFVGVCCTMASSLAVPAPLTMQDAFLWFCHNVVLLWFMGFCVQFLKYRYLKERSEGTYLWTLFSSKGKRVSQATSRGKSKKNEIN